MNRPQRILALVCSLAALLFMVHTLFAEHGYQKVVRLQRDLATTQARNQQLARQAAHTQEQISALRTRPEVQRQVLRDTLGYVRPDELVLDLGPGARDALAAQPR